MLPTFWGTLVRYVSRIITPRNWVINWVINTFQDSSRHCLAIQEHLSTAAAHNKTFPQASEQVAKPIQPQLLQPLYTIQYYIAAPPALDPAPKALTAPLHPLAPLTKPKLSSGCSTAASHFANCQAAAAAQTSTRTRQLCALSFFCCCHFFYPKHWAKSKCTKAVMLTK